MRRQHLGAERLVPRRAARGRSARRARRSSSRDFVGAEHGEQVVAGVLQHLAAVRRDDGACSARARRPSPLRSPRDRGAGERGRADDVEEQDADLAQRLFGRRGGPGSAASRARRPASAASTTASPRTGRCASSAAMPASSCCSGDMRGRIAIRAAKARPTSLPSPPARPRGRRGARREPGRERAGGDHRGAQGRQPQPGQQQLHGPVEALRVDHLHQHDADGDAEGQAERRRRRPSRPRLRRRRRRRSGRASGRGATSRPNSLRRASTCAEKLAAMPNRPIAIATACSQ